MNIYDISKIAGVSIATVSRVLNNSEKVSEKTRLRILNIIEENGYSPVKRQSSKKTSLTDGREIGILCSSLTNLRTAVRIDRLITELRRYNYTPILISCGTDYNEKRLAFDYMLDRKVQAVIVDGTDFFGFNPAENDYINNIAYRIPVILLNSYIEGNNIYCIICDGHDSITMLTEELIKKEHSKILYLFPSMSSFNMNLLDEFKHTCSLHNIEQSPEFIHLCANEYAEAYEYVLKLLEADKCPEAVICISENIAAAVYQASHSQEISDIEELDIICLGHSDISKAVTTNMTAIDCRDDELGKTAINILISILGNATAASRTIIPSEIIRKPVSVSTD